MLWTKLFGIGIVGVTILAVALEDFRNPFTNWLEKAAGLLLLGIWLGLSGVVIYNL